MDDYEANERPIHYVLYALIGLFGIIMLVLLLGSCSDGDAGAIFPNGRNTDVEHCVDTFMMIQKCFDDTHYTKNFAEELCEEERRDGFDDCDRCYFDCANDSTNCSEFSKCTEYCCG